MTLRTTSYVGTVTNDDKGLNHIKAAREAIRALNKSLSASGSSKRCRVTVKGRLGKGNPNAHHYRRGGKHWRRSSIDIRAEHSTHFDVYVHRRYS
jgi:hypothetical protein